MHARHSRRLARLAVLATVLSASPSRADEPSVAVVADSDGKVDSLVVEGFRNTTVAALGRQGYTLVEVPPRITAKEARRSWIDSVLRDKRSEEAATLLRSVSAPTLILLRAVAQPDAGLVRLDAVGVDPRAGALLFVESAYCQRCSTNNLTAPVDDLLVRLANRLAAQRGTSILIVRSAPDQAEVAINGEKRGVTPFEVGVPPGDLDLEVSKEGYQPSKLRLRIAPLRQREETVVLQPLQPPAARPFRLAKWLVLGAGAGLAVAGGVLLATDESDPGTGGRLPSYQDRTTAGALLLGAGGAALVTSGVLFFLDGRTARPSQAQVGVSVGPRGAAVWGRF